MATPDGTACTSDETCMGGSVCAAGRCRPSCMGGCTRGSRCLSVMGVLGCSLPNEDACSGAGDCPEALTCAAGECRTACTSTSECGPGGRCDTSTSTCDEPQSTGRTDAGSTSRVDANLGAIDGGAVFVDGGLRGPQTRLAQAFTLSPLPSQTVRVLPAFVSPPFAGRDIIGGSMIAPIGVSIAARPDADLRGVGYVGAVDGTGAPRLFRFPGDDPSAATDRSSDLAGVTSLVDLALGEDGSQIRALLLRDRTADVPATQAGWTWAEGGAPSAFDRTATSGLGVYTFGQAAIAGGERSIGPDQDLRWLVRERDRVPVGTDPETYQPGRAYLAALDVGRTERARDATASIFTGDVLHIRALADFALVWDPESRGVVMMRFREEGGTLRTGYERLGFVGTSDAPPAIAPQSLLRTEAVIAVPNGPSTTLHRISCPEASDCAPAMGASEVFLPTPGGTTATAIAIAPLLGGYALVTADSEGIVVRALSRELEEIPGYDDGMRLEALGRSTISDGGTFNLLDLDAYTVRQDDGTDLRAVTLYVAGLFYDFSARQARLWVRGVRVEVP